jgi:replicative DNA helicase
MTTENYSENELKVNSDFHLTNDLIVDALDRIMEISENISDISGVPTGFLDIDLMTSGLQAGDLIVIASRPSIGKSTLALNIAEHISINEGLPVAFFSMELNEAQILVRLIASRGCINIGNLNTGGLTDKEWPKLIEAIEEIRDNQTPIAISDLKNINIDDLREKSLRLKEKCGMIGMVIVDCLQMMKGNAMDNLLGLKSLANELNCLVILTSQVGDDVEFRSNKRPTMFDVRDIPGMEYIPDKLIFLYRDDYYTKDACKEPGIAELNFIRQRTGLAGVVVKLAFIEKISKFETIVRSY